MDQISFSAILFFALWILYTVFVSAYRFTRENTAMFLSILLFAAGLVYTFATPPNQVPDEQSHFLRSHAMAQGQWGFDENHQYPDDVNSFILHFPVAHNNGYPAKEGNTVYNRFEEYYRRIESGEKAPNSGIIIFQFIPYIPGAAGIFAARLMGFGALGAFYRCRIANLIFFAVCCYFALKMAGKFQNIMFILMCLPLMSFVSASCNTDSFLFRLMFLMFGSVLDSCFTSKHMAVFAISFAVLCTCKISYIVFLPLLFAVDREKTDIRLKGRKITLPAVFALCTAVFAAVYLFMGFYVQAFSNYGVIERTMADTDPRAQLMFILQNPFRYLAVFLDTLKNNSFFLFSGGLLGWLDVNLPLINYLSPLLVFAVCVNRAPVFTKEDLKKTAVFMLCRILTYCVAMTGMYLSWTPVTLPQIIGLQARYVYPAFMGFAMAVGQIYSSKMIKEKTPSVTGTACAGYIFSLLGAALMLIVYYLPEKAVVFVA